MNDMAETTAQIAKRVGSRLSQTWIDGNPAVSSESSWTDPTWRLDHELAGRPLVSVHFGNIPERFQQRARELVWSSIADPRGKKALAVSSVALRADNLPYVLNALPNSVGRLSGIVQRHFDDFETDLREDVGAGYFDRTVPTADGEHGPSLAAVTGVLTTWQMIIEQSRSLEASGRDAVARGALRTIKPEQLASAITRDEKNRTPPLPPEVACLIVPACAAVARVAAPDVIDAIASLAQIRGSVRAGRPAMVAVPSALWSDGEDGKPWRTAARDTRGNYWAYAREVRGAFRHVVGGLMVLQFALSARRFAEALSTPAGRDEETGLPACILVKRSSSGMLDLHYVRGTVAKGDRRGRPGEWLVGSRLADDGTACTTDLPLGVEALDLLERLYAPFRELSDDPAIRGSLLVAFRTFPLRGSAVAPPKHGAVRLMMKDFLASDAIDWDSLPDVSADGIDLTQYKTTKGGCIRVTQWRKTMATFMMNIDPRLILPLSRHLKHFSDAITEDDYVSSDPTFLEDLEDAAAGETAKLLYEIVRGGRAAHGPMADRIRSHSDEIESEVVGLDRGDAIAVLKNWSRERGISMLVLGPGKCFMPLMPVHALCHRVARTASWANRRPSTQHRTDALCEVCPCHLKDSSNLDFWTAAYVSDQTVWLKAVRGGWASEYRPARSRAAFAALQITRLGGTPPLDEDLL